MPAKKTTKPVETAAAESPKKNKKIGKILLIIAVIILLAFVIVRNRSLIIVAVVDGQPIWRPAFEQRMISQVGQKTLDDMVNEQILLNEAKKRGVSVSQADVNVKVAEIESSLPKGTTIQDAIASQGMTLDDLNRQVTLQLTIEKMLSGSIPVTQAEIDKYLLDNKDFLTATDEASLKAEATNAIQSEKRNSEFQKLFETLKKNAKVNNYL